MANCTRVRAVRQRRGQRTPHSQSSNHFTNIDPPVRVVGTSDCGCVSRDLGTPASPLSRTALSPVRVRGMQSEADLVERVVNRLPLEEAEAVLSKLEDELITVETIDAGLGHEDLLGGSGIGFSELHCDVVLLSDENWESKYGSAQAAADADPYAWMAASLARLLPDRLQAPSKIWQDTMSALRAADVRSEAQLMSMTKAQLRSAKVPVVASVHLQGALRALVPSAAPSDAVPTTRACANEPSANEPTLLPPRFGASAEALEEMQVTITGTDGDTMVFALSQDKSRVEEWLNGALEIDNVREMQMDLETGAVRDSKGRFTVKPEERADKMQALKSLLGRVGVEVVEMQISALTSAGTTGKPSYKSPSCEPPGSTLCVGEEAEATILQIMEMGFDREEVMKAMGAAFMDPDRAVEYLMTGIPGAPPAPQADEAIRQDVDTFFQMNSTLLTRIAQLTSYKTFNNGVKRFRGEGLEGERQTVLDDFLPKLERDGWLTTAKVVMLWAGERDEEILFGGLEGKTKRMMKKLYSVLLEEEGEETAKNPPKASCESSTGVGGGGGSGAGEQTMPACQPRSLLKEASAQNPSSPKASAETVTGVGGGVRGAREQTTPECQPRNLLLKELSAKNPSPKASAETAEEFGDGGVGGASEETIVEQLGRADVGAASPSAAPSDAVPTTRATSALTSAGTTGKPSYKSPPCEPSGSMLCVGEEAEATILQIMEMGFDREEVMKAMGAAFMDPDRAVEYLMTGIPGAPPAPQADEAIRQDVDTFFQMNSTLLTRIAQLTSYKTFNNGVKRFRGEGLEGERQTVLDDFLPKLERDGWLTTAKVVMLWAGERDEEILFGGLEGKTKLLMKKLYSVLLEEEEGTADKDELAEARRLSLETQSDDAAAESLEELRESLEELRELGGAVGEVVSDLKRMRDFCGMIERMQSMSGVGRGSKGAAAAGSE